MENENRWTKRKATGAVIFILLVVISLCAANKVFSYKYHHGNLQLQRFYELPDYSVDVLVLGSSHGFCDIDPAVLYGEYGIAAFCLGGAEQPMWNTYYDLVEALKTQKPKVVILEAYELICDDDYQTAEYVIHQTHAMKLSKNKYDALSSSVASQEDVIEGMFSLYQSHSRWSEISKSDFVMTPNQKHSKGHVALLRTESVEIEDVSDIAEMKSISQKTEEYYKKIIKLLNEKGIHLQIVITPYAVSPEDQMCFNTGEIIAAEEGVSFTNFNSIYSELGIDGVTDFGDAHHLNYRGGTILTRYIAEHLLREYNLKDRR
jgi:hypothetical protein